MSQKKALICGISGQDGSYLARFLIGKGYEVWGTSRNTDSSNFSNLERLGIKQHVRILSMKPEDIISVSAAFRESEPDEIYNLAGQSSVGLSFEIPHETFLSIVIGTLNVLEACRMVGRPIKLYNAGSSECFGDTKGNPANESTPFNPKSPYAVAKASAYWLVKNYRQSYNLFVCTGILFNHESPLRAEKFVTQKIISQAKKISEGSSDKLVLGRLDISRDWGWAPEYVEVMWSMLQQDYPEDYVISTGQLNSLKVFVESVFLEFGLNWKEHVEQRKELIRPSDILESVGDATKAKIQLKWEAKHKMIDIVRMMIKNEH